MATAMVRSGLRTALRGGSASARGAPASKRTFASAARHDDAYKKKNAMLNGRSCIRAAEAAKWEKITYAGIVTCTVLAVYQLSKGHHHFDPPPPYPYLHIRNKEFPWGPDGLFESKEH
ncbi:hypothetical protein RJ640_030630 [Escallonia rubra]|uniref:Cytochrome c oxidase subunit VIa n=1 Tax=Escallonia rubra TaxID=112253 RepID=A0AA88UGK2_9ASTE|nr:hypothetical protein RJ640_030630 [Escallonia rubra]